MDNVDVEKQEFTSQLHDLLLEWQDLGIDPDDMLKCAVCHQWSFDLENNFELIPHPHCHYYAPTSL